MTKEMENLLEQRKELLNKGKSLKESGEYEKLAAVNQELDKLNNSITTVENFEKAELENATVKEPKNKDIKVFKNFGEQLKAIYNAARGRVDERLKVVNEAQGWNTETDTGGGYAIQTDFANAIWDRMREYETASGILARMSTVVISNNSNAAEVNYVDESAAGTVAGGVVAHWTKEAAALQKSHPKLLRVKYELSKLTALSYATDEQLEDFGATADLFIDSFAKAMVQAQIKGFMSGTGLDEPKGMLSANSLVAINRKTAGTVSAEDILAMAGRTIPSLDLDYVWMIHPDLKEKLPLLNVKANANDTISHLLFMPAGGLSGRQYDTLLGKPIIYNEYCSAIGTKGDVMLVNLSEYARIIKGGLKMDQSIHVEFLTDQVAFRAIQRVNGAPKRDVKLKLNNSTIDRSSFIALDVVSSTGK